MTEHNIKLKRIPLTNNQIKTAQSINAAIQQVQAQAQDKINMLMQTKGVMVGVILEYSGAPTEAVYDFSPDCTELVPKEPPLPFPERHITVVEPASEAVSTK